MKKIEQLKYLQKAANLRAPKFPEDFQDADFIQIPPKV
jgi:hypothetical protein